jgi:hypothetical protein
MKLRECVSGGDRLSKPASKEKSNLASKHTFVALHFVLYCTFAGYMLKFPLNIYA